MKFGFICYARSNLQKSVIDVDLRQSFLKKKDKLLHFWGRWFINGLSIA